MNKIIVLFVIFNLSLLIYPQENHNLSISYGTNGEIILAVDSQLHIDYGLAYPMTYEFTMPNNSSLLTAYNKYKKNDGWDKIIEKTANDYFNGIEAIRFDYANSKAFVSVAFSSVSDSLFIIITNVERNYIRVNYNRICKYYDDRTAVVTTTADDLGTVTSGFTKAFNAFRSRKLWLSCGVITNRFDSESIQYIQNQLDSGFVEIDSHSRSHIHTPYPDYEYEVKGSRDDIISNFDLPSLYKNGNHEYVYSYIYPYGNYTNTLDRTAGENGYLVCRKVSTGEYNFTDWNFDFNLFNKVGVVYEVGAEYGGVYGISDINILKSTFDDVVSNGQIYHFSIHPNNIEGHGDWELPYMSEHLDYISNHKNIWYVGFGHLYLYNLLRINDVQPISALINIKVFLEGPYSNLYQMNTTLTDFISNTQPYNNQPWNYQGEENFITIPNNYTVDWILVSLLFDIDDEEFVSQRAGLLMGDGMVTDLDGESPLRFNVSQGDYYIKIEHRNHLSIISSETVLID